MKKLVGLQLYSVREALAEDFEGTVRKIAEMGYNTVEPAGFPGSNVDEAVKIFERFGLKRVSCHGQLPIGDNKNEVIDMARKLGVKYIFSGKGPDFWTSVDDVKKRAEEFSEAAENLKGTGLKIGNHNHNWEMRIFDGKPAYRIFLEEVHPDVTWQIDTYWVKIGGLDPINVIKEIGDRCPVVHIKDGMGEKGLPFKPLGEGVMDIPAVVNAAMDKEALIVEQDSGEGDMLENVRTSIDYLKKILEI
jgi:sugar phosphate isomerase/epimerase